MGADSWEEALDLDDSDLPSLLRPCKRRRSVSPPTAAAAANSLSQLPSSQSPEDNHSKQLQQPPPPVSGRRTIPGPAGAVQAAMFRKNIDRENQKLCSSLESNGVDYSGNHLNNGVISTQDYIRRAMDDTAEFDDDFTRHPWLSALQFLGAEDGVLHSTPISSIKKCLNTGKVDKIVAVIKSSTPNGLGGLLVLLKDPTGTVGATIHHKVLSESEFGKNLTIGAVLVLQKVAVFAPTRSAHYLNITLQNLVKVFSQNSDSTSNLSNVAYSIQHADSVVEYSGRDKTSEQVPPMLNVTTEETENRQHTRKATNLGNASMIQKQNLFGGSVQFNNKANINILSQDCCKGIPEDVSRARITVDHQESMSCSDEGAKGGNSEGSVFSEANNMPFSSVDSRFEKIGGVNEVEKQNRPEKLKAATLPEWTDEQLNELFDGVDDYGAF